MFTDRFSGPGRALGLACVVYGGHVLRPWSQEKKTRAKQLLGWPIVIEKQT